MVVMRTLPILKDCFILYILVMLAGCSNSSSPNPPYSATIAEGRTAVRDIMAESGATSVSIALVDGDRVIWSEAFGKADRAADRNATTNTLYGICSVSKMLATVATMILVDQEKISLDEPVTTYIKNFSMPFQKTQSLLMPVEHVEWGTYYGGRISFQIFKLFQKSELNRMFFFFQSFCNGFSDFFSGTII